MKDTAFLPCPSCNGVGYVECCSGYMCPGKKTCHRCNGKGKILSKEDLEKKEELLRLLEYK